MNKEKINFKKLAKDRNFQNEIKTIFQYKILAEISKIGNEQIYEIIDYLQSQLDTSNKKLEKIEEYINENKIQKEYTDAYGFRVKENSWFLTDIEYILQIIKGDGK